MIRLQTPSRLHFGLLSMTTGSLWPDLHGQETIFARQFGGIGLMIQKPGVSLSVRPAADWSAEGPLAERALAFARRLIQSVPAEAVRPHHLAIESSAPEHAGLGTGTQLGMAVAQALAVAFGLLELNPVELALLVGRGKRSALGVHGFAQGGFLVEAGKRHPDRIAPLVARAAFPEAWRVVLILPSDERGLHGLDEKQAFQRLHSSGTALALTDALCRLVLLSLLPALYEQDLETFGEALYDFNLRVGEVFAPFQGGPYASPRLMDLVAYIRQQGVRGSGQSSWGPTVFAIVADEDRAHHLAHCLRKRFNLPTGHVIVTGASPHGHSIVRS